jgi:uncharacterized protein YuzE
MRQPVQELIERYQGNLFVAAFQICKNREDAEDVSITYGEDGGVTAVTIVDENGETSTLE